MLSFLLSLGLSQEQAADADDKFRIYRDFLLEQNKLFNLTAITDPQDIQVKHFIDSLAAYPYLCGSVADIGTGAGFPGLPLAVICPHLSFTLIDSLSKRIAFLDACKQKLSLTNVTTLHARAEDLPKTRLYDCVLSRAVAYLPTLCEYCLPFVKIGGLFIAYKSVDCEDELLSSSAAIRILGGKIKEVKTIRLYGSDIERKLILIQKIKDTPKQYPRSGNKPKKSPLLT